MKAGIEVAQLDILPYLTEVTESLNTIGLTDNVMGQLVFRKSPESRSQLQRRMESSIKMQQLTRFLHRDIVVR